MQTNTLQSVAPAEANDSRITSGDSNLLERLGVTPYYKNQWCVVLKGDCREILPGLPDQQFDLMLTDPPYGVDFVSNRRTATPSWGVIAGDDGSLDVMDCLKVALEKLTHSAHLYIFGTFDLSKLKITTPVELIWDKEIMSGGNLDCPWGKEHEPIWFACNGARLGKAAVDGRGLTAKKRQGSVLRVQRPTAGGCVNHPTEKPVELLQKLIESSTLHGESILDPFTGSGSTLVAAHREGRYAIGIEIEERHCETAAKRLEQLGAW